MHFGNHKRGLVLTSVVILSFCILLWYNVPDKQLLKPSNYCSPQRYSTTDEWRQFKTEKHLHMSESHISKHKALKNVPHDAMQIATEKDPLRSTKKYILQINSTELDESYYKQPYVRNPLIVDLILRILKGSDQGHNYVSKVAEAVPHFPNGGTQVYTRVSESSPQTNETVPKIFPILKLFDLNRFKQGFLNLTTGEPVSTYSRRRLSAFEAKGIANLKKYFSPEARYKNFSTLKRATFNKIARFEPLIRLSADRKYLFYDQIVDGPNFLRTSRACKVTIATQCSVDRIHSLVESYKYWNGPISISVFLNGLSEFSFFRSYLAFMERCYPRIHERTRYNVATPAEDPVSNGASIPMVDFVHLNCSADSATVNGILKRRLTKSQKWLQIKWYPQNAMRNLARSNILTSYQITLDIDIMPCPKMSEQLESFLNISQTYTNALVIPTYEVSNKVNFPQNKHELIALVKRGKAQPFHKDIYPPNQNATNFTKWEKLYDSFGSVHVVHRIHQFPLHYEPFTVELNSNSMYNEAFVGYGFTRSSHAYEVFRRNGDFLVLSPIYTIQLGILKVKEWSNERQRQNEYNQRQFEHFIGILDEDIIPTTYRKLLRSNVDWHTNSAVP